jgi:hypothetical protein
MLALVHKLVGNFDLQKERGRVDLICGTRLLALARLLEIGTIAGAVECDFALFAATLRANASVEGRAKPLFFTNFADGATQGKDLL